MPEENMVLMFLKSRAEDRNCFLPNDYDSGLRVWGLGLRVYTHHAGSSPRAGTASCQNRETFVTSSTERERPELLPARPKQRDLYYCQHGVLVVVEYSSTTNQRRGPELLPAERERPTLKAHRRCVSLNSRLESNKEEEETCITGSTACWWWLNTKTACWCWLNASLC